MTRSLQRLFWAIGWLVAAGALVLATDYAVAWKRSFDLCRDLQPGEAEEHIRSAIQSGHNAGLVAESRTTSFKSSASGTVATTDVEAIYRGFLLARLSCTVSVKDGKIASNAVRLPSIAKQQIEIQ